ncbi:hypothetical protein IFM51744_10882 [Aspergillus udagawae]|uniref:Uncharacterized protein n=1 Tax=Aspergillus udagawae TaxID=91492 RepID=A0ABQ1BDD7_9EURO|nr:hypothetical protein IFM51744_10882 [Aspergillus udagawae]GFF99142.1 hypothetical protein IFM53868_10143 [Aspergillus udagawae]
MIPLTSMTVPGRPRKLRKGLEGTAGSHSASTDNEPQFSKPQHIGDNVVKNPKSILNNEEYEKAFWPTMNDEEKKYKETMEGSTKSRRDYPDHIKRINEQVQEILGIDSVAWQDTFYTPLGYDYNDSNSLKGAALVDYTSGTETLEVYLEYKVYGKNRQLR